MGFEWVMEFLSAAGKLFLHPLFYFSFFLCIVMGYRRVKRERKDFKIRIEDGYFELRNVFSIGVIIGLCLSAVTIVLGMAIPFAALIVMGILSIVIGMTLQYRLLTPAHIIGVTIFTLFFIHEFELSIPFIELDKSLYPALAVLMGLLIVGEGILIRRNAVKGTSPKLIQSNRGMTVGVHESQRLWMIPFFLFVPGGEMVAPFEWWPVFDLGKEVAITPILVPFLIGFTQQVQGQLPKDSITISGTRIMALGFGVLAIGIGSIWLPILSIAAAAIALFGREWVAYANKMSEQQLPFYFTKRDHGVLILGVIPYSPADKMALQAGEVITKVNGVVVHTEKQLYEALQRNRAHCKLEVLDVFDQIRFVQRALYEGEHHELGILFVQDKPEEQQVG